MASFKNEYYSTYILERRSARRTISFANQLLITPEILIEIKQNASKHKKEKKDKNI